MHHMPLDSPSGFDRILRILMLVKEILAYDFSTKHRIGGSDPHKSVWEGDKGDMGCLS